VVERVFLEFRDRSRFLYFDFSYVFKSPLAPLSLKRGKLPPFRKGRLGGI